MYSQEPGFTSTYIERDGIDSDCWREKEASVKLGGRGLLFEGFGPLRDRKGAQERNVRPSKLKKEAARPLFDETGPLSDQKGAQQLAKRTRLKPILEKPLPDPFLKDFCCLKGKKGSRS